MLGPRAIGERCELFRLKKAERTVGLDGLGEDPYTHLGALHRRSRETASIIDLRTTATTLANGLIGRVCIVSPL